MFQILLVILSLLYLIYLYLTWNYNYWENRGIPCLKPTLFFGNIKTAISGQESFVTLNKRIYETFKNCRYCGCYFFRQPSVFVIDPEIVKKVLISDFSNFHDNKFSVDRNVDPIFSNNPFALKGQQWKLVRGQISTALTTGRIKTMLPQMMEVSDRLIKYISENLNKTGGILAKELCACYTTDVVGAAALGINAKCFENPKADLREAGRYMLEPAGKLAYLKFLFRIYLTPLADFLKIKVVPDATVEILRKIINEIRDHRRKNNIVVNDYLEYLWQLQQKCTEYDFDDTHVISHIVTFFTDGYETSSIVFQFLLYELASNRNVQTKLRAEIHTTLQENNNELTYEVVKKMAFLECVFLETLRKYPPLIFMWKKCTEPTNLPSYIEDDYPPLKVERGTQIVIPIYTLHHDPKLFPNPEVFDPERFSEARKHEIPKNAFIPFGDGPRICLGRKFGVAQIKVGVIKILINYDISVNPKTIEPLEPLPESFLLAPTGGIWLNFSKLN